MSKAVKEYEKVKVEEESGEGFCFGLRTSLKSPFKILPHIFHLQFNAQRLGKH
jgi:hypothetical protein